MERLFFVRHGETNFNAEGRYAGSSDIDLNEKGLQQARDIANEVLGLDIDVIITSPLKRCLQMSDIIQEKVKVPIIVRNEFRERSLGAFEGLTQDEVKRRYPDLWAQHITRIYDQAPPEGETVKEVKERVFTALESVRGEYRGKRILIVSHGFAGKMIHWFFNQMTEEELFNYKLDNAKVMAYDFAD